MKKRALILLIMLLLQSAFGQTYQLLLNHIIGQEGMQGDILVTINQDRIVGLEAEFKRNLPRATIDLRSFWAVPMFIELAADSSPAFPEDISFLNLNWYDRQQMKTRETKETAFFISHPVLKKPLLLELADFTDLSIRLPAILFYTDPEQLSDWVEAARQWGFSIGSPGQYSPQATLFRNSMRHQTILDIISDNRSGRVFVQDAALIPNSKFYSFQTIIPEKLLPELSDSLQSLVDYILFDDLRSYFACLDTMNRLPENVNPIIADFQHWQEMAQRLQSTHFFRLLWESPAKYFNVDAEYGGIAMGKKANIFFMDKNPIDIGAKIVLIMKDGKFRELSND
ncbi:MAG TPA: hypothetical protein ENN84_06880 [Candidatus Marinimicrobia bacterium]|nr:hypothetical protein [Candidatus Neomarinimicrobiota bacterium]